MNVKTIIPYPIILFRRKLLSDWRKFTKANMKVKSEIPILHLHLADHCNLNCRGCDNFSALAPEKFADIHTFENDCAQVSKLANGKIAEIQLLGGEPLLHPQVIEFLEITRKYFPKNTINIVTNGILLKKQPDEFWESCRKNDIRIIVTKYPIKTDYQLIKEITKKQGVPFSFYGNTETVDKTMQLIPLDVEGKQNAQDSFLRCTRANRCISVDNGKLYTCSLIPYVKYFSKTFEKKLDVTEKDYIDIYKAESLDEILQFVSKPVPFCRFCDMKGIVDGIPFDTTKKSIKEWTK